MESLLESLAEDPAPLAELLFQAQSKGVNNAFVERVCFALITPLSQPYHKFGRNDPYQETNREKDIFLMQAGPLQNAGTVPSLPPEYGLHSIVTVLQAGAVVSRLEVEQQLVASLTPALQSRDLPALSQLVAKAQQLKASGQAPVFVWLCQSSFPAVSLYVPTGV